ncbi:MAG: nucleotidyl transferase AbiEii/AbiGii toxin family protein [Verrucomicrobiales bacterium]|nr:nucleotidyl transferase AbiEii/AbiGii toxin family protein [Verrucomicrobiales bacterium]
MSEESTNLIQQTLREVVQLLRENQITDFLLIGGNAVIAYGVPRFTRDIDFVIPEREERNWRLLMDANGFELINGTPAFCQFLDTGKKKPRIDLMIVEESTWEKLNAAPFYGNFGEDLEVPLAAPQHIIAMKLKACQAEYRRTDATDWSDIIELSRLHDLDPVSDSNFAKLVLRFGSEELLEQLIHDLHEKRSDS